MRQMSFRRLGSERKTKRLVAKILSSTHFESEKIDFSTSGARVLSFRRRENVKTEL